MTGDTTRDETPRISRLPRWTKMLLWAVVIVLAIILLFTVVFPWVERTLEQDPTLGSAAAVTMVT